MDDLGIAGLTGAELIGTGGFAVVYRAEQPAFRRTVAVKLLTVGRLDAATSHRFERECQLMGSLSEHPSIVTMFDAGFTGEGRPYLLMAYMPGGSLADRVEGTGPMSWQEAVPICVRMAGALEVAHRSDVVHRDVKPDNILLSSFGEPQLTDFGIARIAGGPETRSGIITASMAHAAPEVIDGQRPGVTADIYSLGSTLYNLVAGEPAFARDTDETVFPLLERIRTEQVPDLRTRGVPAAVCSAIEAAMEKDPADRPQTAGAFGEMLRDAERQAGITPTSMLLGFDAEPPPGLADTVVAASPAPTPRRRRPRPRWLVPALAGIALVAVIAGVLVLLSGNGGPANGDVMVDRGVLQPGANVGGVLADGERHRYTFDGPEGIAVAVEMRSPDPAGDAFLRVFAPDGTPVAADDDLGDGVAGLDALIVFIPPVAGPYSIEASNIGDAPAEFELSLLFESVPVLHPPTVLDEVLEASPGDRHVYVVEARAGEVIEVVMAAEQPGLDPFLRLYGPVELLAEDDDSAGGMEGLDARITVEAPVDGSYRIRAGHFDEAGGRYRLEVLQPER